MSKYRTRSLRTDASTYGLRPISSHPNLISMIGGGRQAGRGNRGSLNICFAPKATELLHRHQTSRRANTRQVVARARHPRTAVATGETARPLPRRFVRDDT